MPSQRRPQGRSRRPGSKPTSDSKQPKTPIRDLEPTLEPPAIENFQEWEGLGAEIIDTLAEKGITVPTPIQRLSIGPVLEGRDVIAKAETGTGKTLAFGAPMMAKIDPDRSTVLGLIMCPTRELAQQVADVVKLLGEARGITVVLVVGGDPMHPQIKELQQGAQVVVGTPGRVLDLAKQRFLSFPWLEFAVLDEADKMFEIGFADDVKKILAMTPDERQTLMFSATFPREVLALARSSTTNPVEVATAVGPSTVDSIDQKWVKVNEDDRPLTLIRMFEDGAPEDVYLIFCERRTDVDQLMRRLERSKFAIKALHGGYDQAARFRVMTAYRTGEIKALVATDVASRGLDVDHVSHVINFSVPRELEDYTHRIGRTGRAGRQGTAITFVIPREAKKWNEMVSRVDWDIEEFEPRRTHFKPRSGQVSKPKGDYARVGRNKDSDGEREERPRRRRSSSEDAPREERPRRESSERTERTSSEPEERPRRSRSSSEDAPREERPRRESSERTERTSSEREERPRRSRSSSEDAPREERPRRESSERTERTSSEREERPRRRRSSSEDAPREERPRRESSERTERTSSEREERPRRRRSSSEDAPREERPRRESSERTERTSSEREERPRRRRSSSEDAPREERPRRESTERTSSEREERPRRRRSSSEDAPREERPRHESSEQTERTSPDREERPRRSRSSSEDAPREERPRRERTARTSPKPEERPRREDKPRREDPAPAPSTGDTPFGFLPDDKPKQREPRERKPRRERTPDAPKPAPKPEPPKDDFGGFGSGL